MSRIGIMGGTFNPIHTGHLLLAEHVLEMVGLDQVWLIPTGCSYLKRKEGITVLSAEDRYRMVNLGHIADNDRSRLRLDMEIRRPVKFALQPARPWNSCKRNIRRIGSFLSVERTVCIP
ncbi:MAG: nicotinate-nicotinamide nucleotide adenylyltransferase [Waltera sp.]